MTVVRGERGRAGATDLVAGGTIAPRDERARGVLERLPVRYEEDARDAMAEEIIPPGYRSAVRAYFDSRR